MNAWEASGLNQREYCEQQKISFKSFSNWRAQLKREDLSGREARWGMYPRFGTACEGDSTSTATGPTFITTGTGRRHRLNIPPGLPAATIIIERPSPGIEVELSDGKRVRFDRDTDPQVIKRVLTTLEDL